MKALVPYMLLIAIPALFAFVAFDRTSSRQTLRIGASNNSFISAHNMALPAFFIVLFLLLACRHETLGRDLPNYKYMFEVFSKQPMKYFDLFRVESLYRLLNWLVGQFTDNFQVLLIVVAALTLMPIAFLYCRDRRRGLTKIMIFVSMSTFILLFSGLRQSLAIALGVLAYHFVQKKQLWLFLLVAVIALGFHHSAFMIFAMYPLYYMRLKKNHLWFLLPLLIVVFVFNHQIFNFINLILSGFNEKYEIVQTSSTGAYMSLVLFALFTAYSYLVADESQMDEELYGLRNFLLLTVFLQCFAPIHTLSMRLNYYYIIFVPLAVSKMIDIPRPNMMRVANLAAIVIPTYFTFDFIYKTYQSYVTGISALDTIPYVPFWG